MRLQRHTYFFWYYRLKSIDQLLILTGDGKKMSLVIDRKSFFRKSVLHLSRSLAAIEKIPWEKVNIC